MKTTLADDTARSILAKLKICPLPVVGVRSTLAWSKAHTTKRAGRARWALPAAQALLGHASVQTIAGYAKTDVSKLRAFVDTTCPVPDQRGRERQTTRSNPRNSE
jgi:hypothetical protein